MGHMATFALWRKHATFFFCLHISLLALSVFVYIFYFYILHLGNERRCEYGFEHCKVILQGEEMNLDLPEIITYSSIIFACEKSGACASMALLGNEIEWLIATVS